MPERFSGRLCHALKRFLGPEVVSLIAQALAGPGIRLHWDTDTPLRQLWPELAARGVPEDQWPVDDNDDGSEFYAGYFRSRYGNCRSGCDTSAESDGESFELEPRPPNRRRRTQLSPSGFSTLSLHSVQLSARRWLGTIAGTRLSLLRSTKVTI